MGSNETLMLPLSGATLVFGLEWLPLLGGRAERLGLRLARQHKATHMVLAGESAGSVGIVSLKTARAQRKMHLHSAAQNVAQLFSTGTIALLLELEQAGYWLVAIHEGVRASILMLDTLCKFLDNGQILFVHESTCSSLRKLYKPK